MAGLVGALLAAVAYGAATVLQAIGVRRIADHPSDARLFARARAGWLYGIGLLLDLAGFGLSFAALRSLPLFLVESVLASSVAVTALLAVWLLRLRLSRREVVSLAVVGIGLVLLAVSAQEGPAHGFGPNDGWWLLGASMITVALLGLGLLDRNARRSSTGLAVVSGLGFAVTGVVARGLEPSDPLWLTVAQPALWALAISAVVAIVAYACALERGRATSVAAITFAIETVVPAAVGLWLLGDQMRDGFVVVATVGFLAALGGCLGLAGRAEV